MNAPRLHLIMPCARPKNIVKLAPRYLEKMEPHPFELRWYIFLQGPEPDPKGSRKVNEAIDQITNGWLMTVADDTDQHPALFRRLHEVIVDNPNAGAIVFSQDRRNGRHVIKAAPENLRPCHCCGGQIVWNREFLGSHRFPPEHGGCADAALITTMYGNHPDRFVFVPETLTKFGSLEWT